MMNKNALLSSLFVTALCFGAGGALANDRMAGHVHVASAAASMEREAPPKAPTTAKPELLSHSSIHNALRVGRAGTYELVSPAAMTVFYEGRKNRPYWVKNYGYHAHVLEFVETLEAAWQHGLRPQDYHLETIKSLIHESGHLSRAHLELILTDAFVRYAQDLNSFRFAPESMKIEVSDWAQMTAEEALEALSANRTLSRALEAVEPQSKTYKALQAEYIRLLEELPRRDYSDFITIDFEEQLIRPGETHAAVPLIRERLGLAQPAAAEDLYLYDAQLERYMKHYQEDNGLEPDGLIGKITLQYLNRTTEDKIYKLLVNMERYRWMPTYKEDRFIMVNIPSGELWAIDDGEVVEHMPAIVGKPWRKTRIFRTEITGVRFNPDWTVPPTIKRFDVVPAIKRDVAYLEEKGMSLYTGHGHAMQTVDPASIDWTSVTMRDLQDIRIVQEPGDHNPLGRIRILMPNKYNIYLHDTNHPEFFDKTTRQLSSGCIRMKYPERIAQFVMDGSEGWDRDMIDAQLSHLNKTDMEIEARIPSYTVYYTTWVGRDGRIVYGPDVYGFDADMIAMMKEQGIAFPQASGISLATYESHNKIVAN